MIPDDSVAGAMDASRDPDTNLEEASKKTVQGEEQQDINDNHTKVGAGTAATQNNDEASIDSSNSNQIVNGLAEPSQSSESQVNNTNSEGGKESDSSSSNGTSESVVGGGGEGEGQMEVQESEDSEATAATVVATAAAAPAVALPGSTEDEDVMKDDSEDDEDKLVINEGGVEKRQEDSNDEDSKESLVPVGGSPTPGSPYKGSAPCTPKRSEKRPAEDDDTVEVATKRQRPLEDLMTSLDGLESVTQVEGSLGQVKRDLQALEFLIKQKEEEWNTLLRLQKRKEELYLRLIRRRQVLMMRSGVENQGEFDDSKIDVETVDDSNSSALMFLPQGGYSSLGGPQVSMMMMNQLLSGSTSPSHLQMPPQIVTRPESTKDNGNISVIDIMTSSNKPGSEAPRVSMSAEAHSKLSKQLSAAGMAAMKPILPKPVGSGSGSPTALMTGGPPGNFPAGVGPQGPTINVQALIAAHRKENPNAPPASSGIRTERRPHTSGRGGKRGDWRRRYDGDRRSTTPGNPERPPSVSSSSSEADTRGGNNKSHLHMSDPNVSYKDVLLQFAQLTQAEKQQPGSPQISIFPVGASESRKSEGSRESTPGIPASLPSRDLTPPNLTTSKALQQEGGPSALARLLMESRGGGGGMAGVKVSEAAAAAAAAGSNSQYLTLSALLSGGSTTTNIKDKMPPSPAAMQQQIAQAQKQLVQTQGESRVGNKKPSGGGPEESGNPKCQGCHKHRAQFVCAGCGNQWYCSRECQVQAWEEHSEHCNN